MTDFLVKCFVKDHDKTEEPQVRTSYGILASIVGICCNLLLFASKLFIGILVNSVSVMADAFNNLSDAASSIIGFIGVRMAGKPADSDHPFGHGRINSKVMEATAADAMGDVMTTSAAILSLLALKYLNWNIDGVVGLAVSVAVMYGGLNIAKDTLAPLIGEAIDPEIYEEISNFVEGYEGILGTHDLLVHNYGTSHSMASIHAEVPSNYDPEYSHEIIDRIERDASKKFNMMLVIHMDPVERDNKRLAQYRSLISRVLMDIDIRLSFHDFRMVGAGKNVCLVFDLVVPREYKASAVSRLKNRINNEVSRREPGCRCSITAENSFRSEKHVSD